MVRGEPMTLRVRIESDEFVAALVLEDDHVIGCPPRLAYMRGWDVDQVLAHVTGRGWRLQA